jgi:CheY-like chemotaxis protein
MVSKSKSILLVDDDPDVLELMSDILEAEGHRVIKAADGLMGTLKVKNQEFDLIISDLNMPKQDGMKFLTNIVKERKMFGKKIPPIIMMSGEITPMAKEICHRGQIPILEKPFSSQQILEEIDNVFKERAKKASPTKQTKKENSVYETNEVIFNIGDPIKEIFLIKSGHVRLYNKNNVILEELEPGSIIGTSAALAEEASKVKAIATEKTEVSPIPIARIKKLLKEQPRWFQAIFINMAKENLKLQDK